MNTHAQELNYINTKTSGFLIGSSFVNEKLPEGDHYHPIKFIYKYAIPLLKKKANRTSNIFLQLEPQINPIIITNAKNAIEFGINVGFLYHKAISDKSIIFGGIGSGPHYISVKTTLQAKGFIFSDNFILGYRQKLNLKKTLEINIQTRFRHISNAGLKEPNLGIDNFFILLGLSKFID